MLEHVRVAALTIENQFAARQSLRHMHRLTPLFSGLEHYSKVADVLCNGTPFLPWIWALITLVLRVASEYVEAFEQIVLGYSRIASSLKRFNILGKAFARNADFQQTLAAFYADILQFHKHAYKFVTRNGWKLFFLTSWGRFQRRFDGILEDMQRHESLIDNEANALGIAQIQEIRSGVGAWRDDNEGKLAISGEEQTLSQYQSIVIWLKANDADQLAIHDVLRANGEKYPGTCSWVLKNQKVIDFLKVGTCFVVYHFCTYAYVSSTTYEQILKSLILQLVQKNGDLTAHQENVWVVVDGLDECEADTPTRLVSLMNSASSNRPSPVLSKYLRRKQILSLTDEKAGLEEAIRHYASQRLLSLHDKFEQLDVGAIEIENIERGVAQKADGMFLYARLVLDYLAINLFYTSDEIHTSIDQLPEKIADFYRTILGQILTSLDYRSRERIDSGNPSATQPIPQHSSLSTLVLSEPAAFQEHGIASIIWLQEFHLYAAEYWTDYVLSEAKAKNGLDTNSSLFLLAYQLAEHLSEKCSHASIGSRMDDVAGGLLDERLAVIEQYGELHGHIARAMKARSLPHLEKKFLETLGEPQLCAKTSDCGSKPARDARQIWSQSYALDGISALTSRYQHYLRWLLSQSDVPGVSAEDFDVFKQHFKATLGFEAEEIQIEHQTSHFLVLRCTFLGCQYPAFVTSRALKSHMDKHHKPPPAIRAIRRVGKMPRNAYPSCLH
ncbi:hypothetical protein B0H63DRAFT_492213 [Podospora didyma]|uniref:DUF7708 domain-containing protein n=1 Tax=Podospora didyma TaxID=330526 RepID=A0AAE0U8W9_9PEZI|nr:hypothetical protein B0H63DRAFT_492213 [Podospora didyma]